MAIPAQRDVETVEWDFPSAGQPPTIAIARDRPPPAVIGKLTPSHGSRGELEVACYFARERCPRQGGWPLRITAAMVAALLLALALLAVAQVRAYDWAMGNTSIWMCAAAYCETNTYMTRTFKGPTAGFVVTNVIDYKDKDVQGFVGYLPSESSIFVAFRGSTSVEDWLNNLDDLFTDYNKCDGCKVHKGFYGAQQSVIGTIIPYVQALKQKFPSYTVVVTGHSLGAAMATLTTVDLMDAGVSPIRMFHFGSPRVGNTAFAEWFSDKVGDRNRNTHYKDIVPHVPMHERYTHHSGEWYEDSSGLHQCSGLEDPKCSYQWHITSIDDHMHYLGLYVQCESV